jgi:photosystem II stability/assembly factor-like uncharacterized protein
MKANTWRTLHLLISLMGAAMLLTLTLAGARVASAPVNAAPGVRPLEWRDPPGDPEIGAITVTADVILSDTAPGGLARTVYFNNKNGGTLTVTVAVTGTPTLTLTGGAAFNKVTETEVVSTIAPFEGIITYEVETGHGTQPGVLFTATSAISVVAVPITFVQDIAEPVVTVSTTASHVGTTTFPLYWFAQDTSGIRDYVVNYYTATGSAGWHVLQSGGLTTSLLFHAPEYEMSYTFVVTAYDRVGNAAGAAWPVYVGTLKVFLPLVLRDYPPIWNPGDGIAAGTKVYALSACTGTLSNTVYAGTLGNGAYRSMDAGANWSQTLDGLRGQTVYGIAAASDCSTVYATTWGLGAYKSVNGGNDWYRIDSGLSGNAAYLYSIALSDTHTLYLGTADGVYKSANGGSSWSPQGLSGSYVFGVSVDPQHPQTVYAATRSNGVYSSTNGGASWALLGLNGTAYIVVVDPRNSNHLLAATDSGVYRSVNSGRNWSPVGPATSALWVAADPYQSQFFAGYAGLGVYRSADGITWATLGSGLGGASLTVNAVEAGASTIYAGTNDRAWRYPRLP